MRAKGPFSGSGAAGRVNNRSHSMKIMLLAGAMITLPAIAVATVFFGRSMMIPALVSLAINFIPFVIAGLLLRDKTDDMTHH